MEKRQKNIEENANKVVHLEAAQKLLNLNPEYLSKNEKLDIKITELIDFAKDKLINNPLGVVIKIKSEDEKKADTLLQKNIGIHPH
ncbi:MAG: hypothetical protein IT287_07180 [Bdellovibrionaceae bacterium]|nr:hypothetical protein [Pseudobdellovibrionaceae bacterium]